MRLFSACAILVLAQSAFTQATPQQNLDSVLDRYKLRSADIKPWHLIAEVQLYNAKGKPTEAGTIEEHYAGKDRWRKVYTFPNFHQTVLRNDKGTFIRGDQQPIPLAITTAYNMDIAPSPDKEETQGANVTEFNYKLGSVPLTCNALQRSFKRDKKAPPMGLFPTYCRDSANHLRLVLVMGGVSAIYNTIGTFQGSDISMNLTVLNNGTNYATLKVKELRIFDPDSSANIFMPATDAIEDADATHVAGGVMAGKVIKKIAPEYPPSARQDRVEGTVILHAIIAKDGTIRKLRIISAPSADLAMSAVYAVRQWTYTPYLLNGRPTEVDTTITVNYKIGV